MRVSLAWLKNYVDVRLSPKDLAKELTMAGLEVTSLTDVEQDTIMEIEVTPNRTDCLSIIGVAREVAAISGKKLKLPKIPSVRGVSALSVPIQIQDKSKKQCLRYIGRVIKNVNVGPSPEWLVQRLENMGVRAVNNIVDITNFCLLEFGQPLHAFDLDKLQGSRIIVRAAQDKEEITTIDGVRRELKPNILVIADKNNPCAIAGIMGGKTSEVCEDTRNILLESAYFDASSIQKASRELGLATQSSYRFERGVDLEGVCLGSLRATELIKKLAGPGKKRAKAVTIGRLIDKGKKKEQSLKVRLNFAKVSQTLGVEISPKAIKEILRRLGFSIVRKSKDGVMVVVPSYRSDITREADLIEEITRLFGYENIPVSLTRLAPELTSSGKLELASQENNQLIRETLVSLGFNEIMTYSLINRGTLQKLDFPNENLIALRNALSYDQEILRPTLLAGMLGTILTNINRKNMNLKLFELSRTYTRESNEADVQELDSLCVGIAGKKGDSWLEKRGEFSFFDLKGALESLLSRLGLNEVRFREDEFPIFTPGRCASVVVKDENFGFLGEVKRQILNRFDISCPVYLCELKLNKLIAYIAKEKKFVPMVKFPSTERDISLVAAQEVSSGEIIALINKIGRELVAKVTLFDEYFGEQIPAGFRGLAYSIEYQSSERTLTAEEVDKLHQRVRLALTEELKLQLR